jgi:hypothetical protein
MRLIPLLTIILLFSCQSKNETIVNRQQAIKKEIEQVKASYFQKSDSLESVKNADTNSTKQLEISKELVLAEGQKNFRLIPLQREYDSLEVELTK